MKCAAWMQSGLALLILAVLTLAIGQAGQVAVAGADAGETGAPAEDSDSAAPPTADEVMRQLQRQRRQGPLIEPDRTPQRRDVPAAGLATDPAVLGVAPGEAQPPLRREGEFVISRRGRVVRSADGAHSVFVFDADGQQSAEPPMVLMPCQMRQSMEDMVREQGDRVVFIVSGQVFVYRGANHLLPTMMKLAEDRDNLAR